MESHQRAEIPSEHPWVKHEKKTPVNHPHRQCIISSFALFMLGLTCLFFGLGFGMDRPLLGPLFLAAVIPSLFILYMAYHKELSADDEYSQRVCATCASGHEDKVPLEILIIGFSLGILITLPVGVFGGILQAVMERALSDVGNLSFGLLFSYIFIEAFLFTAFVEESAKYFCAQFGIDNDTFARYISHPYGLVLFGLAAALGFAALENVTYVFGEQDEKASWMLALVRALLAVPLHGQTGALIGIGLARRKFLREKSQTYLRILLLPVAIHGFYDFVWMSPLRAGPFEPNKKNHRLHTRENTLNIGKGLQVLYGLNLLVVFFGAWYTIRQAKKMRDAYVEHEDTAGAEKEQV